MDVDVAERVAEAWNSQNRDSSIKAYLMSSFMSSEWTVIILETGEFETRQTCNVHNFWFIFREEECPLSYDEAVAEGRDMSELTFVLQRVGKIVEE